MAERDLLIQAATDAVYSRVLLTKLIEMLREKGLISNLELIQVMQEALRASENERILDVMNQRDANDP